MTEATDFWSRRKARVREERLKEEQATEAERLEEELALREQQTDEEILAELDLPDPDSLKAGDDFSAFMQKAVPDRLRRRALRKLWLSNPALANLDGLLDYGEDFTDSAKVIENLQTTYQVGKGMLKHILAMEEEEAAAKAAAESEEIENPDELPEDENGETAANNDLDVASESEAGEEELIHDAAAEQMALESAAPMESAGESLPDDTTDIIAPRPIRRMQFAYSS
ncbi:DUF3306 domain-containing protein [Coralliovum pocilloporae]|uniref:DUF3306 domain-containing protein n=1 Tax=Coralliovum pocilloporae TaxID=3066369 RepID=UPI0033073678